jgi:hypothetical protein
VGINPFCYEKILEEIRRRFFDNEAARGLMRQQEDFFKNFL